MRHTSELKKKEILRHFVIYGTSYDEKYRITGYHQGPIVFF